MAGCCSQRLFCIIFLELQVSGLDPGVLMALYKRGLVYIEVPIAPDDIVSIPHLEGFVSNRVGHAPAARVVSSMSLVLWRTAQLDEVPLTDAALPFLQDSAGLHADPMEQLLHQVFVAASENITVRVAPPCSCRLLVLFTDVHLP